MNFKLLIVEDEEIIRLGLQDNFEMEGYTVETACDGEEAIAKADSYQPHLVLLDLMIPKRISLMREASATVSSISRRVPMESPIT